MRWTTLALAAALLATAAATWRLLDRKQPQPAPTPPIPVTAATAHPADLPVYLRGIGTVRALEAAEIHPQVTGILLDIPVHEGQDVRKGDVLAIIDPRPNQAALDKARAQRQQDQAQRDNAQADLRRTTALAQRDFASRQQLDTQTAALARFEGVLAADDAEIAQATINLDYAVLRAPFDGRIGLRRTDPGNLVQANATGPGILSIVQTHPIAVVFTLPETDLPRIRQAMAHGDVPVLADSSDLRDHLAAGRLLTPDNAVDPASGTISAKARFENADAALTPGQFVSIRIQVDTAHGIAIPHEAVQHAQTGLFVLTARPDDTADRRPIQVAYDDGATTLVASGIEPGDRIIVSGQSRVGPGTKLAPRDNAEPANQGARQ